MLIKVLNKFDNNFNIAWILNFVEYGRDEMVEYLLGIVSLLDWEYLGLSFINQIVSSKPISLIPYTFDDLVDFLAVVDCFDILQMEIRQPLMLRYVFPYALVKLLLLIFRNSILMG